MGKSNRLSAPSVSKRSGQLGSVLDWLIEHHHSRTWLAEQITSKDGSRRDRFWASKVFLGEVACTVPELVQIYEITGLELLDIALECHS